VDGLFQHPGRRSSPNLRGIGTKNEQQDERVIFFNFIFFPVSIDPFLL
jgi:hypothetical protein